MERQVANGRRAERLRASRRGAASSRSPPAATSSSLSHTGCHGGANQWLGLPMSYGRERTWRTDSRDRSVSVHTRLEPRRFGPRDRQPVRAGPGSSRSPGDIQLPEIVAPRRAVWMPKDGHDERVSSSDAFAIASVISCGNILECGKASARRVHLHHVERRPSWDLDNKKPMKGAVRSRILALIAELKSEGSL